MPFLPPAVTRAGPPSASYLLGLALSLAFLVFLVGMVVARLEIFPFPIVQNASRAATSYYRRHHLTRDRKFPVFLWYPAPSSARGVTRHVPAKVFAGLTLYTTHETRARLVDMQGRVVHEWSLPFSRAWRTPEHVTWTDTEAPIYWRKAHLLPNGDLLAIYENVWHTPYGFGLVKMNKNSQVVWKYSDFVHHDLDVDEQGHIYTLTMALNHGRIPGLPNIEPPFIDEFLDILDKDGRRIKRISLLRAFLDSDYRSLIQLATVREDQRQILHSNNIDVLDRERASHFPFLKPGQLLLSFRNLNTIAVLDPETERIIWALTGLWKAQHDPDFLDNGHMLIFDNEGNRGGRGGNSRVVEVDPLSQRFLWTYAGSRAEPFGTLWRGSQQRLPNGNTLVTESERGRIFEVTSDKEIVWEYRNPERGGKDNGLVGVVDWGVRYAPGSLPFLERDRAEVKR